MAQSPIGSPLSMHDPRTVGPWAVNSRLGAGGMGVVYHATSAGQEAAVKVIRPGLLDAPATRERFGREVAILRSVRDVHISQFLSADLSTEPAWLAIEYISGPVLRDEVLDHGPLAEDEWWDLARGLAQALAVLEVHRVTHRDIKPGNVILNERGPVLIDFGIAHPEDATSLTATGLVTGSPAWLSPEQANLEPTGPASDVFCLGSLLAFAATGRPPFGEGASVAVLVSIATREPDLAGVDAPRRALLTRMLAKDPTARPAARELLALARRGPSALAGLPDLPTASQPPPVAPLAAAAASRAPEPAGPAAGAAPSGAGSDDTAATAGGESTTPASSAGGIAAPDLDATRAAGGEDTVLTPASGSPAAASPAAPGDTRPGATLEPPPARPTAAAATAAAAASAAAVASARASLEPPPRRPPAGSRVTRPRPEPARRRGSSAVVVLLLVAVLALGAWWFLLREPAGTGGNDPGDGASGSSSASSSPPDASDAPPAPSSDQLSDGVWMLDRYQLVNSGSSLSLTGTVRNKGTTAASADLTVWIYQGGQPLGAVRTTVTDLAAGASTAVTMTGDATWKAGQKVVLLQAD